MIQISKIDGHHNCFYDMCAEHGQSDSATRNISLNFGGDGRSGVGGEGGGVRDELDRHFAHTTRMGV